MKLLRNLYLTNRFFIAFGVVAALFALSFAFPFLFILSQIALALVIAVFITDIILLFHQKNLIKASRKINSFFNLGDENKVQLTVHSSFNLPLKVQVIDELPVQFQIRDFQINFHLKPGETKLLVYDLRPVVRGAYRFGRINLYLKSMIRLIERRIVFDAEATVPVYPSFEQMQHYELIALSRISTHYGIKKLRRIGHSYEFEQIKNYVQGDDYRSINWKATGRRGSLMVNQYEDERAQQVYSIIDKGRAMRMPFNEMSLMDYAINTSLVISNIALKKYDKAGLITFSDKIGNTIKADSKRGQLRSIVEALYNQRERQLESNFELLFTAIKAFIRSRSLIFLYTNFESYYAMERVLPLLRKINRMHVLVVVFFENAEIKDYSEKEVETMQDIYNQTIAEKFISEKYQIVQKLNQFGIQPILTRPEDLSMNTVNKYLEMKSRGII